MKHCLCAYVPKLELETRVEVIMHTGEWPRSSNTGRLATLTLANAGLRFHGSRDYPLETEDLVARPGSLLTLFPGCGAKPLTPDVIQALPRPFTLIVPDGNWGQTKSMMRRLPFMRQTTPVELPGPRLSLNRPRRNIFADRMSTFEAIAQAIGCLESEAAEEQLLDFFTEFVARFQLMRGKSSQLSTT